jgi:ankyrin repeat protein
MLIERGADVTAQNKDGQTPLHLASQMGQVDVARMLIERGADVTAQNNDGSDSITSRVAKGTSRRRSHAY